MKAFACLLTPLDGRSSLNFWKLLGLSSPIVTRLGYAQILVTGGKFMIFNIESHSFTWLPNKLNEDFYKLFTHSKLHNSITFFQFCLLDLRWAKVRYKIISLFFIAKFYSFYTGKFSFFQNSKVTYQVKNVTF